MLRSLNESQGYTIAARDGELGAMHDFCFDDESWVVRYLVHDTRVWLPGRRVLISPISIQRHISAGKRCYGRTGMLFPGRLAMVMCIPSPLAVQSSRSVFCLSVWVSCQYRPVLWLPHCPRRANSRIDGHGMPDCWSAIRARPEGQLTMSALCPELPSRRARPKHYGLICGSDLRLCAPSVGAPRSSAPSR